MPKIEEIKAALRDRAEVFARYLYPEGKQADKPVGNEWWIGDVAGNPGDSLKIIVAGPKAGTWKDFATGEGGSLVDLWMLNKGLADFLVAAKQCEEWLAQTPASQNGHENPHSPRPRKQPAADTSNGNGAAFDSARIFDWDKCVDAVSDEQLD